MIHLDPPWELQDRNGPPCWYLSMPGAGIHDVARVLLSLPADTRLELSDGFMDGIWYYPALQPGDKTGSVFF